MRFGLVIVALTVAVAAVGWWLPETRGPRPAVADESAGASQLLGRAVMRLERDDAEGAVALLEAAMQRAGEGSVLRHTAGVLHEQVTGGFAERLEPWLRRKVADVVVLVEDEREFFQAVDAWEEDVFWPVLMADDWYAPLFIEAFRPAKVLRWPAPGEGPADEPTRRRALAQAVRRHNAKVLERPDGAPLPPGMVVIDPAGPQRAAGYALAVAHGQPILALESGGSPAAATTQQAVERMNERIMRALRGTGLLVEGSWSALTLAGEYHYQYDVAGGEHNPLSVDDRIGRDERQVRRAFTGRLIGDGPQAVYQAMGSLFLQPREAMLINGHWAHREFDPEQPRSWYQLTHAAERLGERYDVTLIQNDREAARTFYENANPSPAFDFLWVNSAHGRHVLEMPGEQLYADDTPVGRAMAMYVVASFGATDPWNEGTIAGLALRGGAFWYFGSTDEPYLQAFVQSTQLAHRMRPGTPLGAAARQPTGHPFARPWKLMLVGDPLFTLRASAAPRVPAEDFEHGETVVAAAAERMPAGRRLGAALLLRDEAALRAMLEEAAAQPEALSDGELAHVVRLLHREGRVEEIAALPAEHVKRHPVSLVLTRRVLRDRLRGYMETGRLNASKGVLAELSALEMHTSHFRRWAEPWLVGMHGANRGAEGERFVRTLAEASGSRYRQRRAEQMIEAAREAASGE